MLSHSESAEVLSRTFVMLFPLSRTLSQTATDESQITAGDCLQKGSAAVLTFQLQRSRIEGTRLSEVLHSIQTITDVAE